MEIIGNIKKRLIYVYEFPDNSCYVGLTFNIKKRNRAHLSGKKYSAVYEHIEKTKLNPTLKIVSDYVDVEDAINMESTTLDKYENEGWLILNRSKVGSLGSKYIKWTYDKCKEEVKKYDSLSEFRSNSSSAYQSCLRNKWLDELCKDLSRRTPRGYWNNKAMCSKESKKYKNVSEFRKKNWSAYNYSKKNNWLCEFFETKK